MTDSFSRFDTEPVISVTLDKLLMKAARSRTGASVRISDADADFLIAEGGGADPEHTLVPQQLYIYNGIALVVRKSVKPIVFRV